MRFLIWRNGKLGNTIAAIPFILHLRRSFPDSHIAVVVEGLGRDLLFHYPQINELIVYHKRQEHRSLFQHLRLIRLLRKQRFTHSFHLKRFFRNAFLSWAAGIPNRLGFVSGGKAPLLTGTVPYREDQNIILTNLSLLTLVGIPAPQEPAYEFFSGEEDRQAAARFLSQHGLRAERFAVIHGGGQTVRDFRVPPSFFGALASALLRERGLTPVFVMGPGDEPAVEGALTGMQDRSAAVLCDSRHLSIRVVAEILRQAAVFLGSNSGQAHLAALAGVPEVVLYLDAARKDPLFRKWHPWQAACGQCFYRGKESEGEALREALDSITALARRRKI